MSSFLIPGAFNLHVWLHKVMHFLFSSDALSNLNYGKEGFQAQVRDMRNSNLGGGLKSYYSSQLDHMSAFINLVEL